MFGIINGTPGKYFSVAVRMPFTALILVVDLWVLSTVTKVRTTLHSVMNSTAGKYCSVAFI